MTNIYSSLCKVETVTRLLKFFSSSLPVFYFMTGFYEKRLRPVLKPNLVVEIEIIPSCLTANLDLYIYIHLITSFTFKLSSLKLNSRLGNNNSGQIVKIMYYRIYNCVQNCENENACSGNFVKSCSAVVIFTAFESNQTASTGLSSF